MDASNDSQWVLDEEPVHILNLDQLRARPRYLPAEEIDLELDPVRAVIGWYDDLPVDCALRDHTPHRRGYLCRTASGAEVCVGHVCGKRRLGENFQVMINVMTARASLLRDRAVVADTVARTPAIRARLQELRARPYGADWLASQQEHFFRRCPRPIFDNLRQRAAKGLVVIHEDRRLSSAEMENLHAMGTALARSEGSSMFDRREVGRLAGLAVMKGAITERIEKIERQLGLLEKLVAPSISPSDFRKWAKWCSSLDRQFAEVEGWVAEGRRFFTAPNLALLQHLALDSRSKRDLSNLHCDCYQELSAAA